jgi:hypothetical protein
MLACASDLLFDLAVYGGPVFILAGFVWISTVRERRRTTEDHPLGARQDADAPV